MSNTKRTGNKYLKDIKQAKKEEAARKAELTKMEAIKSQQNASTVGGVIQARTGAQ